MGISGKQRDLSKLELLNTIDIYFEALSLILTRLGTFKRDGSLWENMVPFWTADNKQ